MINKEELSLYACNNYSIDYYDLWFQIASEFIFVKYNIDNIESKSIKDILIQDSRYISHNDYKIIWNSTNECILINKLWKNICNTRLFNLW